MSRVRLLFRCLAAGGVGATIYVAAAVAVLELARAASSEEPHEAVKLAINVAALGAGTAASWFALRRFAGKRVDPHAWPRFAGLTVASLAASELVLAVLLAITSLPYPAALGVAWLAAGVGFLAGCRRWVFAART